MQFQVPQFIEVEDKIFGPLTFKQFVYVAGGAGACYIFFRIFPLFLAAPLIIATGGFAAALAFFEYNGRPFIHAIEHGFYYLIHSKLYLWNNKQKNKVPANIAAHEQNKEEKSLIYVPKLSDSKLHDLAWSLDIKERIAEGESVEEHETDSVAPMRVARSAMR